MRTTLKKQKLHTEPRLSNVSIKLIFVLIYIKKNKKKKKLLTKIDLQCKTTTQCPIGSNPFGVYICHVDLF